MKKLAKFAAGVAAMGCIAGMAQAEEPLQVAALGDVSGRVMVYDGSTYSVAKTGMPLGVGDQVVTLNGGKAEVAYQQGCVATLDENAVLAISGVDMCATNQAEPPLQYAQAIGSGENIRLRQRRPMVAAQDNGALLGQIIIGGSLGAFVYMATDGKGGRSTAVSPE